MLVLMVNTDPEISSRVRRMVARRRGQLRLASHQDFESAAREGKNENVAALVVPFDSPDRFSARILHWLWTWEGDAVPYLVSSKGSPGNRVMSSLAPSARGQNAPAGMQASASESAQLNWLPVKALPLESLIAIGHFCSTPPTPRTPMKKILLAALVSAASATASAQGQINIICTVQAEWCNLISTVYARTTGVKVNMSLRGGGEALAQLIAEKENPKTDIWFGGTGDPHLQAAEQGLTLEYKSPSLPQLHSWAQRQAQQSAFRTVGIYSGPLGFGYNPELLAKKKLPVPKTWADLTRPEYKGEVQVSNPASSGTAYTMIATLVQLMGEEQAYEYLKRLHKNVSQYARTGVGPIKAVARGESAVSISFVHDGPGEKMQGFPVETITPADGTGAEIGSMSLVKGARNLEAAKKFYEWALTPAAQELAAAGKQFQLPSNPATKIDSRIPDFKKIKFIDYDYAKYGTSAERRRLITRWEKDVNSLPR